MYEGWELVFVDFEFLVVLQKMRKKLLGLLLEAIKVYLRVGDVQIAQYISNGLS